MTSRERVLRAFGRKDGKRSSSISVEASPIILEKNWESNAIMHSHTMRTSHTESRQTRLEQPWARTVLSLAAQLPKAMNL